MASKSAGEDFNSCASLLLIQKLLTEIEKKLREGQPVKRSKKIIIQEVEDQRRDEDVTETGLYTIITHTYIQVIYPMYIA